MAQFHTPYGAPRPEYQHTQGFRALILLHSRRFEGRPSCFGHLELRRQAEAIAEGGYTAGSFRDITPLS